MPLSKETNYGTDSYLAGYYDTYSDCGLLNTIQVRSFDYPDDEAGQLDSSQYMRGQVIALKEIVQKLIKHQV